MTRKIAFHFLVCCFFLNVNLVQSQSKEKRFLAEVLSIIELRYNVNFTYLDQTIEEKRVSLPSENLSLQEVIDVLRITTKLDFILLDTKRIVISKRNNPFSDFITQKLEEVVVTNYLTQGISKKSDGKINIRTKDFGILPGLIEPDVLQSVQALPGILSIDERVFQH